MGTDNKAHVRLQTLLNVSAAHPRDDDEQNTSAKRVRVSSRPAQVVERATPAREPEIKASVEEPQAADSDEEASEVADAFHAHFGAESADLQGIDTREIAWSSPEHSNLLGGATNVQAVRPTPVQASARVRA